SAGSDMSAFSADRSEWLSRRPAIPCRTEAGHRHAASGSAVPHGFPALPSVEGLHCRLATHLRCVRRNLNALQRPCLNFIQSSHRMLRIVKHPRKAPSRIRTATEERATSLCPTSSLSEEVKSPGSG